MLGAVAGDTIGSVYEFDNTKDYDFPLFDEDCIYTDDSILSFAVAEWLLKDKEHTFQGLEDCLVKWTQQFPSPMGDYGRRFQSWAFNPKHLLTFAPTDKPLLYSSKTGRVPYESSGNGSAMRVSPVGWFFSTLEETEHVAELSASITHNSPGGIKGAQATAAAIWMARNGKSKEEIQSYIESRYGYDLHKTYEYWHEKYRWDSTAEGTVPQAIICFLESKDFEDAIRKGVSLGGDSDTLACITGGIAEAFYHGVPAAIADKVIDLLPSCFVDILKQLQERTEYGKICPIVFKK